MSASTLSVFEHQTIRVGQEISEVQFDSLVRMNERAEEPFFEVGHRRITFRQYVGYLQVGRLGIEVLPKADRGAPNGQPGTWHAFLLEMLRAATGLRLTANTPAAQDLSSASLLDVLAREFAAEVTSLARAGLAKCYRSHEANESTFRGKLLVAENVRANLGRADRIYSRFTTFDAETTLNRLLCTTLRALSNVVVTADARDAVHHALAQMPELPPLTHIAGLFERIALGRSTARYGSALLLARLILERQMPQLRAGSTTVFSLMFDMNVLWERYVVAILRRVAARTSLVVDAQAAHRFWRAAGVGTRTMRPDIVIRHKSRNGPIALILDTKWKRLESRGPKDADLRQMFAYGELLQSERTVLLYPSVGAEPRKIVGRFENGAHCDAVEVALLDESGRSARAAIEAQLLCLLRGARASL